MSTPLTDDEVNHLLEFIGYGRLKAPVWFISLENAGGDVENVSARLNFQPVEDFRSAYKVFKKEAEHVGQRVIELTWHNICYIMLGLEGKDQDLESIRTYQSESLGRKNGSTMLCELMPIPNPMTNVWGYGRLIPQFMTRSDYYQRVKPFRIEKIRNLIRENQPKVVICHGRGSCQSYREAYKALFPDFTFPQDNDAPFTVSVGEKSVVVLADRLAARTLSGKLDQIVEAIKNSGRWSAGGVK